MRRRGGRDGAVTLFHLVLVAVVASGALAGYIIYAQPRVAAPAKIAVTGDTVSLDYIGRFVDGTVFDTSLKDVAQDNTTYPKAPVFSYRGNYQKLNFTVGTGAVVLGFDQNVTGMREGDTKTFRLVPQLAYGPSDPTKLEVKNLTEDVKWTEDLKPEVFRSAFGADPPSQYTTVRDPVWGWEVTAFPQANLGDGTITIVRYVEDGTTLKPFGAWDAQVVEVNSAANRIRVRHLLTPGDAGKIAIRSGTNPFIISKVDATTFTLDHNQPLGLKGQTLAFTVTLVSVTKPGTKASP